ncbi:hypothetical protein [Companilactobacillus pabuli]|uniref:hypothetical protein n=1 Tax=Companilactobacillus pabuli TaxID=2714036 RepID=UPI002417B51F|nr:hypothetical protein [Companilactobacillus pabuli]MDG5113488.1 hypothetical protein [Companilactobacillus pabuli]
MKLNNPTDVIALIGAITGSLSLLVNYLNHLITIPKIDVDLDDTFDSYWSKGNLLIDKTSRLSSSQKLAIDANIIVISLLITNQRNIPVTIQNIELERGNIPAPSLSFNSPKLDNSLPIYLINAPYTHFPLRLEPYDISRFSIVMISDEPKNEDAIKEITLNIKTPYKNKEFTFDIKNAHYILLHKNLRSFRLTALALQEEQNNKTD